MSVLDSLSRVILAFYLDFTEEQKNHGAEVQKSNQFRPKEETQS